MGDGEFAKLFHIFDFKGNFIVGLETRFETKAVGDEICVRGPQWPEGELNKAQIWNPSQRP
jgi:hypothetical protein